jgi:pimeloyl-ACP methyl ester carboxylesterase
MLRICVTLGLVYSLFLLAVMFLQRRLIYFPTAMNPKVAEQIARRGGFEAWRNSGGQIIGWHWPALAASSGAVLIVHGNGGCAIDRAYLAGPIREASAVDVFVLEYPGYGVRDGTPSEQSWLAAADEAFERLPKNVPIFVVSESLGAGVAAHLAGLHNANISGVMLFAPYNDLASVAQGKLPILPVRLLLRDRFDPARWLRNYHGPVGVVLAEADEVIPAEYGRRLYEGYDGPKKIQIIPGAHHNDIAEQSPQWWKEIFSFWKNAEIRARGL